MHGACGSVQPTLRKGATGGVPGGILSVVGEGVQRWNGLSALGFAVCCDLGRCLRLGWCGPLALE
jgi:hypothetical protein